MSTHPLLGNMFAGDDWQINATLLDQSGAPYDLTGTPTILWTLMNRQAVRVIESNETTITVVDGVNGKCKVLIPHTVTTRLASGLYVDALRIVISTIVSTLSTGQIQVTADPWRAASATRQFKPVLASTK